MNTAGIELWSTRAAPHNLAEVIRLAMDTDWWATAWWCRGSFVDAAKVHELTIVVQTIRGPERARLGDFIVHRGPGDFTVVGPEEFLFTYQPCDDDGDEL